MQKQDCSHDASLKLYWYICRTDCGGMGVLMYGYTGYCLPLLHLGHQHVCICPDVDVRTLTLHLWDSKLNANLCITQSKFDDTPMYGRTQHLLDILQAGRAYGNPKIQSTTRFKICKHNSTRYLCNSTSKLINCNTMMYLSSTSLSTLNTIRIQEENLLHTFSCSELHRVHLHSQSSQGSSEGFILGKFKLTIS
jgi:hypothetical protein